MRPPRVVAIPLIWLLLPGPAWSAPKGDVRIDGAVDSLDALVLERGLRGLLTLSSEQQAAADVAPMVNGASAPNGVVDTADLEVLTQALRGADLDGDGLTARFENLLGLSPFARDTNANGTDDDDEDPDQDGLANGGEQANGFDPLDPDTDGDGILDGLEVAPAPAVGVATDIAAGASFLYTGENPIQTGVDPPDIEPRRAAVVRGQVLDRSGQAVAGASITVLGHSELGETRTLVDGSFELVVNGGGRLTIEVRHPSYLLVQRTLDVPWRDYVVAPDVVLTAPDAPAPSIALPVTAPFAVVQSSLVSDLTGTRRATYLFPQGTTAAAGAQSLASLTLRSTEFTAGSPTTAPGRETLPQENASPVRSPTSST
jgi:hypothetical protein